MKTSPLFLPRLAATLAALALLAALLAGCAGAPAPSADAGVKAPTAAAAEDAEEDLFDDPFAEAPLPELADPLEPLNRAVFWVNDKLYFYLIKPVVKGYRFVLPEGARLGIAHFFTNIAAPLRAANNLVQLDLEGFSSELMGFVINSTAGFGGFMDLKPELGLDNDPEDFGQTLGHYGVGHGFYLVLPLMGPSSLRDASGAAVDWFADPVPHVTDFTLEERLAIATEENINRLSLDKDTYEAVVAEQLDPYLFMRQSYIQFRRSRVDQ